MVSVQLATQQRFVAFEIKRDWIAMTNAIVLPDTTKSLSGWRDCLRGAVVLFVSEGCGCAIELPSPILSMGDSAK
jgi:hypothetical protein